MFHVKVDDREINKDLLKTLKLKKDLTFNICRLPVGDYQVDEILLVERKTIADFCISIKDGRLFRQAAKLSNMPMQSVFILEGKSCDFETLGFRRETVQGALVTLALVYKIPLLRSQMPEETVRLIIYAARQIISNKHLNGYSRSFPYSRRLNKKYKRQIHVLQGLPGIGPKRAKLLLDKFGTLRAIFNAPSFELEKTLGIGKSTAKQISRIIE